MKKLCLGGNNTYVADSSGKWVTNSRLKTLGDSTFKCGKKIYVPARDGRGGFCEVEK